MKKFFSLVLALVMALSLTTVAWGAVSYDYNVATSTTGTAAFVLAADGTYDGTVDGATLTFDNATGPYDAGIVLQGNADVTNVKIVDVTRGIESGYEIDADTITIDNVVVEGCVRAMHINTISTADLYVSNSTFEGKISYDIKGGNATFVNCIFKYNDELAAAKGNMVESYDNVAFVNCTFEEGFEVSFDNFAADDELVLTNCTYDGEPLTADNMDDLFTNTTGVDVDDVVYVYNAAEGANGSASGVYAKGTWKDAAVEAATVYSHKAVDNKVNKDGSWKANGNVEYYTLSCDAMQYVKVSSLAKADMVIYTDAACKNVYMYLAEVDPVYAGDGVVTKNFGTACGQYSNDEDDGFDDEASYYVVFDQLCVAVEEGDPYFQILVNGKLVKVDTVDIPVNAHKAVYTKDAKGEIASIKCSACGLAAVEAANYATLPVKPVMVNEQVAPLWYWPAAATVTPDTTVESAATFDAGIALYVGMSVMAATGAVVLKKRGD